MVKDHRGATTDFVFGHFHEMDDGLCVEPSSPHPRRGRGVSEAMATESDERLLFHEISLLRHLRRLAETLRVGRIDPEIEIWGVFGKKLASVLVVSSIETWGRDQEAEQR